MEILAIRSTAPWLNPSRPKLEHLKHTHYLAHALLSSQLQAIGQEDPQHVRLSKNELKYETDDRQLQESSRNRVRHLPLNPKHCEKTLRSQQPLRRGLRPSASSPSQILARLRSSRCVRRKHSYCVNPLHCRNCRLTHGGSICDRSAQSRRQNFEQKVRYNPRPLPSAQARQTSTLEAFHLWTLGTGVKAERSDSCSPPIKLLDFLRLST